MDFNNNERPKDHESLMVNPISNNQCVVFHREHSKFSWVKKKTMLSYE